MKISDLITVHDAARSIDLATIEQLLDTLALEGNDLTLGTATQLGELLGEYVGTEGDGADPLRAILTTIAQNGQRGGAFLVRGTGGSGKSHLLAAVALLLKSPAAWSVFLASHASYTYLGQQLKPRSYLTVPIPLSEHRGSDEHLEDIVFDRTERVLRTSSYSLAAPLGEQSYALDLIDRHIVPRYTEELEAYTVEHGAGARSWKALREKSPAQAVQIARSFAREIKYPLDFRQSRVERLSTLLDIATENKIAGIVWLLDDLNEFLSGVSPKAVHGDCSFLDFIGQRCKIGPLSMVATLDENLEQLTSVEPYLLNAIRSSYRTDLHLSADHMRAVARRRVIGRVDDEEYQGAIKQVEAAFRAAFGEASFAAEGLAESYPLHPLALEALESIASRFFGAADTLVAFMQDLLDQTHLAGVLQRDFTRLISVDDVFDYLRPRIASHPEVSAYIYDVLDYYHKNAQDVFSADPTLCERLVRILIVFRLANMTATLPIIAECMGVDDSGQPVVDRLAAERALEAMRLAGKFVDLRRSGPEAPPAYFVDVGTSVSETVRKRISAAKAALAADDPRIWRHLVDACDEAAFPLAQLREPRTLEAQWQNTFRCVSCQVVDLKSLAPAAINEYVSDLADAATVEDAYLFLAPLSSPDEQLAAWNRACETTPASRWSAAILAWVPRELNPQELDQAKEFAAIAELAGAEKAGSDPSVHDQVSGMIGPATEQARKIVCRAYYEGRVLSPFGPVMAAGELPPLSGNWAATVQAVTSGAFEKVFPDFLSCAPRRPLVAREQIDALVDRVIRPGAVALSPDDPLTELVQSFLQPLGLIITRDDNAIVDVSRSKVAADVMQRVRQRDQTPQQEVGRPISCADLAQHLMKSTLGLTPELFEFVVAALVRTGYLAPVRDRKQLVRLDDVATPLSSSVEYVARPPLLNTAQWQVLSRVCRIALDLALPGPDYAIQQKVWERLLRARGEYIDRAEDWRRRLEAHLEELDQRRPQWSETFADIAALESSFRSVNPDLHPAIGLMEFVDDISGFIGDSQGTTRLSGLFRRLDNLDSYLEKLGPEVAAVREYLLSPELQVGRSPDQESRRQTALALVGSGEKILSEEMNLRRQVQIFLAAYKRQYISWHGRVYRSPVFDQYRAVHQSPEMRALNQLSKIHLDVNVTADDMAKRVEEQVRRRCTRGDLSEALDLSPVCPDCRLQLDREPDLLSVDVLMQEVRDAVTGHLEALASPRVRQRLRDYASAIPKRGDLAARIVQIPEIDPQASPREILTLFTDDTISHLNRALSGKVLAPRNFGELRKALEGRTITKEEAQGMFRDWLEGEGEEIDDDGLLQIGG